MVSGGRLVVAVVAAVGCCLGIVGAVNVKADQSVAIQFVWDYLQSHGSSGLHNWGPPWPCELAEHVACDEEGNVVEIVLSGRPSKPGYKAVALFGPLAPEIGKLTKLSYLDLSYSPGLKCSFPDSISRLTDLHTFLIEQSSLFGRVPDGFSGLTKLRRVDLTSNYGLRINLDHFVKLKKLTYLKADRVIINSTLPHEMGDLRHLRTLALTAANLTGFIPDTFSRLTHLTLLHLPGNFLEGSVPSGLSALANLEELMLTGNPLTGPIPSFLGTLPKLDWLDLDGTQFEGEYPFTLANQTRFKLLKLGSSSQLFCPVGVIPGCKEWIDLNSMFCQNYSRTFCNACRQEGTCSADGSCKATL